LINHGDVFKGAIMGDHQKRVEKIATEITGLTVKTIVTA
jgi:hypothetical protein